MIRLELWRKLGPIALIVGLAACAGEVGTDRPGEPAEWTVSEEPTLNIGVVEGRSMYQFFAAKSAIRFDDGAVMVANTGTGELRYFDAEGRFVWRAGGRGGGPGEFGALTRIYRHSGDSVLAFDLRRRMSVFDRQGSFVRSYDLEYDEANPFPLDSWLYLKNLVEGPLRGSRAPLRRAMDHLPPLPLDQVFRFVFIDDDGLMWSREPLGPSPSAQRWTVFDSTGAAVARVDTPLRFDVFQIGRDYILGRWLNEDDVEFVHVYALTRTQGTPVRLAKDETPEQSVEEMDTEEFLASFRSTLRQLVGAQERHYANNSTYTRNVADLEGYEFEGVMLDIVSADGSAGLA